MSSSKSKKVHYDRGTKSSKSHGHAHRSSRDSGVGSSSASDKASLGTAPKDEAFSLQQVEDQRYNLLALQEAYDTAQEKIAKLEAANEKLNSLLFESNKDNRGLKRQRNELHEQLDQLQEELDLQKAMNRRLKGETSPRTSTAGIPAASSPRTENRPIPTRRESIHREQRPMEESPKRPSTGTERRRSWREMPVPLFNQAPPSAPQPPPNNPFAPLPTRTHHRVPTSAAYGAAVTTPAYAPVFGTSPVSPRHHLPAYPYPATSVSSGAPTTSATASSAAAHQFPNDGLYHLHRL